MLAVRAPVGKSILVAGAALAVAAFVHHPKPAHAPTHHLLTLHAQSIEHAVYLTVFAEGRIQHTDCDLRAVDVASEGETLRFATRARIADGCVWEGHERLVPIDAHSYAYSYDEQILSCEPGSIPAIKTPRTGIVTVDQ
jgi:hypothetical protein